MSANTPEEIAMLMERHQTERGRDLLAEAKELARPYPVYRITGKETSRHDTAERMAIRRIIEFLDQRKPQQTEAIAADISMLVEHSGGAYCAADAQSPAPSELQQMTAKEDLILCALFWRIEDDIYKVAKPRFNQFSRDSEALYMDVTEDSNHVTRYLARQQANPQQDGWRDIESAPKDTTPFMAYDAEWDDYGLAIIRWDGAQWIEHFEDMPCFPFVPTHWQPLPSPPTKKGLK